MQKRPLYLRSLANLLTACQQTGETGFLIRLQFFRPLTHGNRWTVPYVVICAYHYLHCRRIPTDGNMSQPYAHGRNHHNKQQQPPLLTPPPPPTTRFCCCCCYWSADSGGQGSWRSLVPGAWLFFPVTQQYTATATYTIDAHHHHHN